MSSPSDEEPFASPTPGQLLDARMLLDDQTFDALDDQHRRLAVRVDARESAVAVLEGLLLRSPGQAGEPTRWLGTQQGEGAGRG